MRLFLLSRALPAAGARRLSYVLTLAMAVVALGLTATTAQAQTPPPGAFPPGMLGPAAMTADLYAALEYCEVDEDRLESFKNDMRAKAQGIPPERFDEMFAAALPEARQEVEANAAAHPEETEQFCEIERGGF